MSKPKLLVLGTQTERMAGKLEKDFDVLSTAGSDQESMIAQHGSEIEYVLSRFHGDLRRVDLERMPNLKVISNYGVGYDSIDTTAAVELGIIVTHTPDVLNDEVSNTAIMLLLACARNLVHDENYLRARRWPKDGSPPLSTSVSHKVVGLVGFGRIGQTIAEKLRVFGTDIVYHARSEKDVPYRYYKDLTQMAADADFLIVITPGGPSTRHLIDNRVMEALGPKGCLINISRGSVVDENALISALQTGRLGKAGLDVFENEPHVPDALMEMDNVVLLPHVGSATVETRQAMGDLTVENLIAFYRTGKTVTPVPECRNM
ncbi:2-hydroxyacid dehydrogenase [Paraglaciecola sp. 20A4]|uniref:2-hydroxyacid dehydrogenase n=1 Tax=Paraglaciecola sp. 20A4 TaxID=2687288 RepID=UPI001409FA11|nr:2-hydroxyacid dehydrogenase [Paraglaciecola sp. 20A4]